MIQWIYIYIHPAYFLYDLRGVVLIKVVWLWVWFYSELPVPKILIFEVGRYASQGGS